MNEILVIWDYSSTRARILDRAIAMARLFGAKIHVAVFNGQRPGSENSESVEATIVGAIDRLSTAGVEISHEFVAHDDMAGWVMETAESGGVDMVIKAGDHAKAVFYTPTDWKLIRQLKCPLLICSTRKWKSKPRLLATVDAASRSKIQQAINGKVLDIARQLAVAGHSELHVAYTIAIARVLKELVIVEPPEVMRYKGATGKKKLQEMLDAHGIKADAIHVTAGNPASEIASTANKIRAELVIMGSVGRKGVKGVLLGNTAEEIIKNLRTDLLIIKP